MDGDGWGELSDSARGPPPTGGDASRSFSDEPAGGTAKSGSGGGTAPDGVVLNAPRSAGRCGGAGGVLKGRGSDEEAPAGLIRIASKVLGRLSFFGSPTASTFCSRR